MIDKFTIWNWKQRFKVGLSPSKKPFSQDV